MGREERKELDDFAAFFERCKEPFTQFANSYLRDRAAAEDIYVESMMQYWERRHELAAGANAAAYVLTTVKNRALNHLRHREVRMETEEMLYDQGSRELAFRIATLESCDPSELFTVEIQRLVRQTLAQLPEQTRLIFYKSRFEGKSNREIADEMGMSVKNIEYHISKALKSLRLQLRDYLPLLFLLFPEGIFPENFLSSL